MYFLIKPFLYLPPSGKQQSEEKQRGKGLVLHVPGIKKKTPMQAKSIHKSCCQHFLELSAMEHLSLHYNSLSSSTLSSIKKEILDTL